MKSYLKTSTFTLPDGESITIRELSAGARRELVDVAKAGDTFLMAATAARAGCSELSGKTPQEILDEQPIELLNDLAAAVMKLSGLGGESEAQAEKN